jgi:hypothetical protein
MNDSEDDLRDPPMPHGIIDEIQMLICVLGLMTPRIGDRDLREEFSDLADGLGSELERLRSVILG